MTEVLSHEYLSHYVINDSLFISYSNTPSWYEEWVSFAWGDDGDEGIEVLEEVWWKCRQDVV